MNSMANIFGSVGKTVSAKRFRRLALAGVVISGMCGQAWARFTPPPPCKNPYTQEQEISEGNKVALQVYQQMPVLPESDPVSRYVAQLGRHLSEHAPGGSGAWPYSFHVVASADVNAFALPGGAMFVNLGTVQAAQTEAQLAGVMSHELSHVILRHATCNLGKQQNKGILFGIGAIASEILLGNGAAGQTAVGLINGVQGLEFMKMSRDDEKQADLMGTDTLYDSGYDPRGLPQFFEVIQAKYGAGGAQMLSDHPNPGNRTQYVNDEIATLPGRSNSMVTSAVFARIHNIAAGEQTFTAEQIKAGQWKNGQYATQPGQNNGNYGQNGQYPNNGQQYPNNGQQYPNNGQQGQSPNSQYPNNGQQYPNNGQQGQYPNNGQQGQYPNGQNPNQPQYGNRAPQQPNNGAASLRGRALGLGRLTTYNGPGYSIAAPQRWTPTPGQNGTVVFAPAGGSGSFGIVYGALVDVAKVADNGITDADSLARATTTLVQQMSQQNGGLQQTGQIQTLQIGGQGANAVELRGASPLFENGRALPEHDWVVTVARPDGDLSYMVFVSPERDFGKLRSTFVSMMQSFRVMQTQQ